MIKFNNSDIIDWNFDDNNIIKVYHNGAIVFYKFDTEQGGYKVCYAVVNDISQYSETEFEDVFDKATEKWYKLNNLNQYEEYGVYGSGRNITYYDGKLTIDDGYEYIYSGGSWTNVGEISGSSITIKSPEYIKNDSSHNGKINLDYVWKTNSKMQFKFYSTNNGGGAMIGEDANLPDNNDCRMFFASTTAYFDWGSRRISWLSNGRTNTLYEYEYGNYYIKNMVTSASKTSSTISTSRTNPLYLGQRGSDKFRTYYLKFYDGDTLVKDFIPWTDMNGNYGLFDKVSLSVYNVASGTLTGSSNVTDVEVGGGIEYPLEYVVREDPPDNLVFSSMAEAQAYAEANCVYDGMHATINGDSYHFDSTDENGWVKQTYTQYEYIRTENNSNKYYTFNTGFYPTTANTIEIKMEMVDTSVDWGSVLGWASCDGDSCDSTQFRFTTVTGGYAIIARKGNTSGTQYYRIGANNPITVKMPLSASTYTYNSGTTDVTCNFNVGTMNLPSSTPLHLCGIGYNRKAAVMKVYYVKVYDGNNNLVKHYVPSDNNGTPCFYEIVDGEYIMDTYTGSNHGTLTLGPAI